MKELIDKDSAIYSLPVELDRKSQLILDSLRVASEMGEHCFNELIGLLEKLSNSDASIKSNRSIVFNYAWSFIDHAYRFVLIYDELNPPESSIINEMRYIKTFRDAIQHVNKNLLKSNAKMIENGRPTFGLLKWVVGDTENCPAFSNILISGIFKVENFQFKQHDQFGYPEPINNVILETNTVGKANSNEIDLSDLFDKWKSIVKTLNNHLLEQFTSQELTMFNWKMKRDVYIKLKNDDVA